MPKPNRNQYGVIEDDDEPVASHVYVNQTIIQTVIVNPDPARDGYLITTGDGQPLEFTRTKHQAVRLADMYLMGYSEGYDDGSVVHYTGQLSRDHRDAATPIICRDRDDDQRSPEGDRPGR